MPMQILAYIMITIGLFFIISSIVGLFRFPDFYTKIHAASVADSFGIPLCLLGLAMLQTSLLSSLKILIIMILFFLVSPASSHALVKAAWTGKLKPYKKK
jgi:multicomponent Na+:H+ antiporter subunit G